MTRQSGFSNVPSGAFRKRFDEDVLILSWSEFKTGRQNLSKVTVRPVGEVYSHGQHSIPIKTIRKGIVKIPVLCAGYIPPEENTGDAVQHDTAKCPMCEIGFPYSAYAYVNVIVRDLQDRGEPNPVRVLRVPPSLVKKIRTLQEDEEEKLEENKRKTPGCKDWTYLYANDKKRGFDIVIKFDPDEQGKSMYSTSFDGFAPLTKREKKLDLFDLWSIGKHRESYKKIITILKGMAIVTDELEKKSDSFNIDNYRKIVKEEGEGEDFDNDEEETGNELPVKKNNKVSSKSKYDKSYLLELDEEDLWGIADDLRIKDYEQFPKKKLVRKILKRQERKNK